MGSKGSTGAGVQHTSRGPTQGVALVGPNGRHVDVVIDGDGKVRLLVDANVTVENATINVDLDSESGDNVAIGNITNSDKLFVHADGTISIRLLDETGTAFSTLNPLPTEIVIPAGGLEVKVEASSGDTIAISGHQTQVFDENEVTVNTGGSYTNVLTYVAPFDDTHITFAEVTGPVDSVVRMRLNGTTIRKRHLTAGAPNVEFPFIEPRRLTSGQSLTIDVKPDATPPAHFSGVEFFASIQGFIG